MKYVQIFFIFMILTNSTLVCQVNTLDNFYGINENNYQKCIEMISANKVKKDVLIESLVKKILQPFAVSRPWFKIGPCSVSTALAIRDEKGMPYILYNPTFFRSFSSMEFSTTSTNYSPANWEILTVLSHEIAHHLNNHLVDPPSNATSIKLELEADETAGFILFTLGATLAEAQAALYNPLVSEKGSLTHPPRSERLKAIELGYIRARGYFNQLLNPIASLLMTDIDGTEYEVTKVGSMSWTKRNLEVSRFRNGDLIPHAQSEEAWKRAKENQQPAWCYYDNNPENGKIYGKLYNWYAVNDTRGICPKGWHVPKVDEWTLLLNQIGNISRTLSFTNQPSIAGEKLKSKSKLWTSTNSIATNESGFSAIPGGYRNSEGRFFGKEYSAFFWSSSAYNNSAWNLYLNNSNSDAILLNSQYLVKSSGASVRCLRD